MQRVAATGQPILDAEYEIIRQDGTVVKLLEYVTPLFDEQGRSRGCVGAFIDVTERKRLEDQLKRKPFSCRTNAIGSSRCWICCRCRWS